LLQAIGFEEADHSISDLINNADTLFIIIFAIFIGPISEELTFRLGLKFSYFRTSFNIALLAGLVFILLQVNLLESLPLYGLILGLTFLISNLYLKRLGTEKVTAWYLKHFNKLFYTSVLLFGLIHLTNYTDLSEIWLLTPLLFLPQLLAGLLFGYVRSSYGFIYSILLHIFHNAITLTPILLLNILNLDETTLASPETLNSFQNFGILALCCFALGSILLLFLTNIFNMYEVFFKPKTKIRSDLIAN